LKILVDADACPVKEIIERVAKKHEIPVVMFIDSSHVLYSDYSEIVTVGQGKDAVDIALINRMLLSPRITALRLWRLGREHIP